MDSEPFAWPEPGTTFFEFERTRPDGYNWMFRTVGEYAHVYLESARVLMDLACDAPGLLNLHALPAVFLFRHFVELSLKDLILLARPLNDVPSGFPDGHQLRALWDELRLLMASAGLDDDESLDTVRAMIDELDAFDHHSMAFRYPVSRVRKGKREPLLDDRFEYFDMRTFRDQARRLSNWFAGCGDFLDHHLQTKRAYDEWLAGETEA